MSRKTRKEQPLTKEELEAQSGEELPDREVMSVLPVFDPHGPSMLPPLVPADAPEESPAE